VSAESRLFVDDQAIIAQVNEALAQEFELDRDAMVPKASLADGLGLDSMDMVDMVIVLERAFGVKIREDDGIRKIRTLGDIHEFVIRKYRQLKGNPG
jgi:acyl carrier protein